MAIEHGGNQNGYDDAPGAPMDRTTRGGYGSELILLIFQTDRMPIPRKEASVLWVTLVGTTKLNIDRKRVTIEFSKISDCISALGDVSSLRNSDR